MALSHSAARTARHRRWLWALTACGGGASLVAVEGHLRERAHERGQTVVEYAQERGTAAADSLKKTSGVVGALLHTAVSSAVGAVQQREFDPGHFRADLVATVADLASETPTRRHLVALGGGYFLDWLLQLAYPQLPGGGNHNGSGARGGGSGGNVFTLGGSGHGSGVDGFSDDLGFGVALRPGTALPAGGGGSGGQLGAGLPPWAAPEREGRGPAAAEGRPSAAGGPASAADAESLSGGTTAAAARLCREAERALESILRDDVAAGLLLDRPGAVSLLLRAVADGRAAGGVAEALAARAAEPHSAGEAMTADLQEAVDALRGRIGSRGGGGGGLALQCTAAGLLSAWAAGSGANRAKLTGLGLQGVLAEVATAASGLSSRAAVGLQWELLRLTRVMAEHSSSSDSHHLAACVLPLLYTAADAAAAEDAAMASYAVDTLAAAVRHGGAPVAEVVSNSTMPHLLWQLAEAMGAHRVLAAPSADGKDAATAAAIAAAGGAATGTTPSSAQQAAAASEPRAKASRGWFASRSSGSVTAGRQGSPAAAAVGAGAGGGGGAAAAAAPVKSRKVLRVQDPAVAASVAAAVAELARCALLPEEQVPRWRDWLLDVLCADGFDPGTSTRSGAPAGADAAVAVAGTPTTSERTDGRAALPQRLGAPAGGAGDGSSRGGTRRTEGAAQQQQQQQRLPAWLMMPEGARWQGPGAAAGVATPAAGRGSERQEEERRGGTDAVRGSVVDALAALSHMPGNHGLQAAHYWLSRLLSELAARTLPYTSLVYLEGPRAPQDLIHAVPVLPSYVKSVADALERAADAVADESPPLPPQLEFDLAGSGLVARPTHDAEPRRPGPSRTKAGSGGGSGGRQGADAQGAGGAASEAAQQQGQGQGSKRQQQQQQRDPHQAAADVAAYRQAAHVIDVVVAERKAADALEALCAIVAPDPDKQRWLLRRGVLPLLHRLTRTADDPRVVLQEQGQSGAERAELEVAAVEAEAEAVLQTTLEGGGLSSHAHRLSPAQGQVPAQRPHQHQHQAHSLVDPQHPQHYKQQPHHDQQQQQQGQGQAPAVVSDILSDHEGGPSLCLQRQVARMLALLALLSDARADLGGGGGGGNTDGVSPAAGLEGGAAAARAAPSLPQVQPLAVDVSGGWLPWLRDAATSSDCRLSSNATRALLHMAALDAAAAATAAGAAGTSGDLRPSAPVAMTAAASPPSPPVFLDGIHLLDPGAQHHWALVRQVDTAATEAAALTTAAATAEAAATVGSGAAAAAAGEARLPTGPATPEATAVATIMAPEPAAAALPSLPLPELTAPPLAVHGKFGAVSAIAGGGSAAVTMGCGAADGGGSGGVAAAAPSVAAAVLGTLRYAFSRPMSLWGATALAAPYGGAADAATPPQPVVAATTAAEPLQASTCAAAAAAAAPTSHAGVASRPAGGSSRPPSALGSKLAGVTGPADAGGGGGGGASASVIPPYPAPYADLTIADSAAPAAADQSAGGSVADGTAAAATTEAAAPPVVDVVFVHGIRGGPFITWRKAGVMTRGSAASHMERSACWPSTWLAEDLPGARLLSVEYLAPVSAWEGESLPLEDNVSRVMGQLAAAGVGTGQRPVVFVAHSMGGLLVKEMLARSMDQAAEGGGPNAALAASTRGIVFFGTPHFGNGMAAMGWKLRHVPGALPAPSLARLTPGPHLLGLNDRLRQLHDAPGGSLRVVSLLEGQPTQLSGVIPRILIVAPDSAYPGFGAALTLPHNDHIDCCKPAGRASPAYRVVRDLVVHAMRAAAPGGG